MTGCETDLFCCGSVPCYSGMQSFYGRLVAFCHSEINRGVHRLGWPRIKEILFSAFNSICEAFIEVFLERRFLAPPQGGTWSSGGNVTRASGAVSVHLRVSSGEVPLGLTDANRPPWVWP